MEAFASIDDADRKRVMARAFATAGNLRNAGFGELAARFAQLSIDSIEDRWGKLRDNAERAEVYLWKAELAWEILGDRELADRYAKLCERAVRLDGLKEEGHLEKMGRLLEEIGRARASFPNEGRKL